MGLVERKAQIKQAAQVCEQTASLKQQYNDFYNSSVDAINDETLKSKAVRNKINNMRAEISRTTENLKDIQDEFKKSMVIVNVGLAISVVITGIMLYLKYKGLLTLNPLDAT